MSRTLTAADRSALIRLASALPVGSVERRAILAGLTASSKSDSWSVPGFKHEFRLVWYKDGPPGTRIIPGWYAVMDVPYRTPYRGMSNPPRTLVLAAPIHDESQYDEAIEALNRPDVSKRIRQLLVAAQEYEATEDLRSMQDLDD